MGARGADVYPALGDQGSLPRGGRSEVNLGGLLEMLGVIPLRTGHLEMGLDLVWFIWQYGRWRSRVGGLVGDDTGARSLTAWKPYQALAVFLCRCGRVRSPAR